MASIVADPALAQNTDVAQESDRAPEAEPDERRIIVTGTLVQRSDYQISSPVAVVGREELEARAPANIAEFVKDLPFNTGSAFASGRAFGNERGAGTINLRGLGASATLVLINGRRQTQVPDAQDNVVDVNSLIPEIMLQRIEILKDGASATYGSDAVAGVVNFITNDSFEGVKVSGRVNHVTYSDAEDYRIEGMIGTEVGDSSHITAAFGFYEQDPIEGYAFYTPSQKGTIDDIRFSSAAGYPGVFTLPVRNAAGQIAGSRRNVVDPECDSLPSSIPAGPQPPGALPPRVADSSLAVQCRYQFWADNGSQSAITRYQGLVRGYSDLTDDIRLTGEFGFADVSSSTAYTPGDTISAALTIPGHNPGNIYYRARNAAGDPLYAVPSGVSAGFSRDGAPVFLPARDASGRVILTAAPTDPASGIPFYEDIVYAGRPLGSQCGLPTGGSLAPGACATSRPSRSDSTIMRAAGELSGELNDNWTWQTGLGWSKYKLSTNGTTGVALVNELNNALAGFGGPGCNRALNTPGANGCQYFNIFGNSAYAAPGSAGANTQEIIDYVVPFLQDSFESELFTADALITGTLFNLPAGGVGVALGYQHRQESLRIDYDTQANVGNKANGVTQTDFDNGRSTNAIFAEVDVPVIDNSFGMLNLTGAVRHEWIGETLETTDPKLGAIFTTADDLLTVRGSWGTSFIAPSLFRLFASSASGAGVNDCPISAPPPCNGDTNLRISTIVRGNPDLRPETSEAWSVGGVLRPMRGLQFELTYWTFDFRDRINQVGADAILALGPFGTAEFPVVRQSSDPNVRSPIVSVTTSFFNQASVEVSGIDLSAAYTTAVLDGGSLSFNLDGTYNTKFDQQATPGGPVVNGNGRFFASSNITNITANVKLRVNGRVTFAYEGHNFSAAMRYYGPADLYDNQTSLTKIADIDSWSPVDLSYTYTFDLGSREAQVGIGAQNVFGEYEPFFPFPAFQPFIPTLYDTRGRSVYAKASVTF
jgi:outer membrane receptor protein involved in Fe transport